MLGGRRPVIRPARFSMSSFLGFLCALSSTFACPAEATAQTDWGLEKYKLPRWETAHERALTEIYGRPADLWAARLTGPAWALDGVVTGRSDAGTTIGVSGVEVTVPPGAVPATDRVRLVVRPDWLEPGDDLEGTVIGSWFRGPHTDYRIDTAGGTVEMRRPGGPQWRAGDRMRLRIVRGWPVAAETGR